MEYIIVCELDPSKAGKAVNDKLQEGWKLHGDLKVTTDAQFIYFSQAMVNESSVLVEWNDLDIHHKKFIMRVRDGNGCKHSAEPHTIDSDIRCTAPNDEYFESIALWEKAEESGFIKCIGSYKWVVTDKYRDLEKELLMVKGEDDGK